MRLGHAGSPKGLRRASPRGTGRSLPLRGAPARLTWTNKYCAVGPQSPHPPQALSPCGAFLVRNRPSARICLVGPTFHLAGCWEGWGPRGKEHPGEQT